MQRVFDRLVVELERPRPLTDQVLRHLAATYGVERDEAGAFLKDRLSGLEDDELDLVLSPLFTPKLADQAIFADLLEAGAVPAAEWPDWVARLHQRPTVGALVVAEGSVHSFELKPVTLERYVNRLRLDGGLSETLLRMIRTLAPPSDQPLLLAVARRAVWNTAARTEILSRFLSRSLADGADCRGDAESLLALVESSEPADIAEINARLPAWEKLVLAQLAAAGMPRPFFNERVQDLHGGGRDQRTASEGVQARKHAELEFLGRLGRCLQE